MSFPEHFISVFARNCNVRRMDGPEARTFIERHHRYGWSKCRYCYGLFVEKEGRDGQFHKGDLVAVSCFSNARKWEKDGVSIKSYEWVRYASVEGVRVSGGMGKMLNAFIEEVRPDDVMSYAEPGSVDCGQVYRTLGFESEGMVSKPGFCCEKFRLKLGW